MASPVVSISEGQVRGSIAKDFDGEQFYSFLGIPYAKPPLGKLRFKAPQPVEPWSGIKDALKVGDACKHRDLFFSGSDAEQGSEDCLYLNVFTRTLPKQENKLKPVMVFIHGGGFTMGSGDVKLIGPGYIMTEDVVFVSINYRVGYLGFLRLNDPTLNVPGNAGLKDQVMSLKWVQRNIKYFNGDPDNVTIFGISAGGASVHYLVLSPSAKGLFHRAIAQSGVALCPWARADSNIFDFLNFIDKGLTDEKTALEFLTSLPVDELFDYQDRFMKGELKLGVVGPVIEKPNPSAFLTKTPMEMITSGEYNKVPLMTGYTSNEGILFAAAQAQSSAKEAEVKELDLEDFVLPDMKLERGCSTSQQICKKIADFYFQGENAKDQLMLPSDYSFVVGAVSAAINHSKTSDHPVFLYRISCETNLNLGKKLFKLEHLSGVSHGDDIGYLFTNTVGPKIEFGEIENICMRRFVKLWTNFAKYGNPTPDGSDLNIQWKPVEEEDVNFLDIGRELTSQTNPEEDRIKFWRDILQLSPATAKYL